MAFGLTPPPRVCVQILALPDLPPFRLSPQMEGLLQPHKAADVLLQPMTQVGRAGCYRL